MNAINLSLNSENKLLKKSVIEIINAKIERVNFQLKSFINELTASDQIPSRPKEQEINSALAQKRVFEIIEKSSLLTSKLYFLRGKVTEHNSKKILQILSSSNFETVGLQHLREEFKS